PQHWLPLPQALPSGRQRGFAVAPRTPSAAAAPPTNAPTTARTTLRRDDSSLIERTNASNRRSSTGFTSCLGVIRRLGCRTAAAPPARSRRAGAGEGWGGGMALTR